MAVVLPIIKSIYRKVVPLSIRQSSLIKKLKGFIYRHILWHEAIYDSAYYRDNESVAAHSAGKISYSIIQDLKPQSVIDVGCGTGALLESLQEKDCQVFGLEYSEAAIEYCRARKVNVAKFDLEIDIFEDDRTFDVALSMEVAEHLPAKTADRYADLLTRLSDIIVFTAAAPGKGQADHVNEQPSSYWISKFQERGFVHDCELSKRWHDNWKASGVVESVYYQNLMIFRRKQSN